jgi:spore coat protein CotF
MNNKIQNTKTEVPNTTELNDCDYLNELLACEKNMGVNLTIALNEASNRDLFNEIYTIFEDIKMAQRDLYNMAFKKGWYSLEKAEEQKISEKEQELTQKLNQLI